MKEDLPFGPVPDHLIIKNRDHFYIFAHGVEGISLKVHTATIDRNELKIKLAQFTATVQKYL